jgi:hypothetical protein
MSSTLRKPDAAFISLVNTIKDQCITHAGEWKLDTGHLNRVTAEIETANMAYAANSDLATRNRTTVKHKNDAFGKLKHTLPLFIDSLISNLNVPDAALKIMGLRSRTHHSRRPLPVPAEAPVASIVHRHDEIIVQANRISHDHPTHSKTTKRYHGIKLRISIEGIPGHRHELSTRLRYKLSFSREHEGKRVTVSIAWINPRLQEGPWSDDISTVIA